MPDDNPDREPAQELRDLVDQSETPFGLCEIDDDVDQLPARSEMLGALGQLVAALVTVAALGLIVLGVGAALSWLFH